MLNAIILSIRLSKRNTFSDQPRRIIISIQTLVRSSVKIIKIRLFSRTLQFENIICCLKLKKVKKKFIMKKEEEFLDWLGICEVVFVVTGNFYFKKRFLVNKYSSADRAYSSIILYRL